jgi:hypothetical protein
MLSTKEAIKLLNLLANNETTLRYEFQCDEFGNLNDAIEEIATISKFFFHSKVIDYNPISGAAVVEFRGLAIDVIDPRNENEVV